jgi:hypothetical protein
VRRLNDRRMRSVLVGLEQHIPVPWSIDVLVENLAAARARPIRLVAWDFRSTGTAASGLWIPTDEADYVFYDRHATTRGREQIIGHELGHMLLEHTPRLADAPPRLLEALAPSVSPELARRFLLRSGYGTHDEEAAERFGTRLVRVGTTKRKRSDADELGRLTDTLQ